MSEEQTYRHVGGELRYFRRDSREVIEAAFTYPVNTKMVKLNKSNLWHALSLKVAEDQQGYVLETKSSVAMALHAAKKIYLDAGFTPKAIYDGGMTLHMVLLDKNSTF